MSEGNVHPRYEISAAVRRIDRGMHHFIKIGGIGIILAVFGIFAFILAQILPLFNGATVTPGKRYDLPPGEYVALGADEWTERPFLMRHDGAFLFVDLPAGGVPELVAPPYPAGISITAANYRNKAGLAVVGTATGSFALINVLFQPRYDGDIRRIESEVLLSDFYPVGKPGHPIVAIQVAGTESERLVAAVQDVNGRLEVHAANLVQKKSLMGGGKLKYDRTYDFAGLINDEPASLLVNTRCDSIMVITKAGQVHYLYREKSGFTLRQTFRPFQNAGIQRADFIFGDDSISFVSTENENVLYSLFVPENGTDRLFGKTKDFAPAPGLTSAFSVSLRNKAFLLAGDQYASLRYGTTGALRWESQIPAVFRHSCIGGKYDTLLLYDDQSRLHVFALHDPHPEASFAAFFGKIWYEGASEPKHEWQSTGGTDDFEPKLSMVPLIIGTLKGTLYAMIFSVPVALLAAMYTSQFASPRLRRFVKPLMEIMASLPSVILGFLAALWLAPLLESRIPSMIAILTVVPVVVIAFGTCWGRLPFAYRRRIPDGAEILAVIPLIVASTIVAWSAGPRLEEMFFVARDPGTGAAIADFRMWWPQFTGLPFEQRNSLVVGFMMGFAVIPIIFTITEDALSNVPATFRSSSLALGASRWQTALRVVLPTASAGIFSAIMIGFGRAVGETMIVLMATGNTPIMDFNIFSGMRTLSANIAVELPEAPHHGTLYRALFLGSMLLFLMTFLVNTLAELLRHHLREKYKAI